MKRFYNKIKNNIFLKNVLILISGTGLSQLIILITSPILTRIYTPEEFGILAAYLSIVTLLVTISSFSYEKTIILPKNDHNGFGLVALSFIFLCLMSSVFSFFMFLLKDKIATILNNNYIDLYVYLLPIGILSIGGLHILSYWNFRKQSYHTVAKAKVVNSFGMVTSQVTGGYVLTGATPLLIGDLLGRLISTIWLSLKSYKNCRVYVSYITFHQLKKLAIRYKKFPLVASPSSLMRQLSIELPILLLTLLYSPTVAGWYVIIQRILGTPLNLIGTSVGNVYYKEATELFHKEQHKIANLFWTTIKHLFIVIFPIILLISVLSPWLIPFVFGSEWKAAGAYLPILACMYLFQFLSIPVASTLYIYERHDLQFLREIIRILLVSGSLIIASKLNFSIASSLAALSLAGSLGFIIHLYLSWFTINKITASRIRDDD
ncbi:lipopolysaccharide biosynthesis protein [Bacillaceae bacterium W0354]